MTDYMPAIMREVNSLYDVDGFYTNGWPPLGTLPVCYCDQCRRLPRSGTPEYWDKFNERTIYLWKLYDSIAKEKRPSNFYFANLGGGIGSMLANLEQLGEVCEWFQADNQGRGGDDTPIWGCALQGRVCRAVQKGKMATNVTGAWSTGRLRWRNVYKSEREERMWFNETLASGMVPYHHLIGGEKRMGEDRRGARTRAQILQLDGEARPALRQQAIDRQRGRGDGPAHATVLHASARGFESGLHGRPVLRAARRAVPLRLRPRGQARLGRPEEILRRAAAEHGAAQRRAVPPAAAHT